MLKTSNDTIVALTTPFGKSGVAVIRTSGEKALTIAEKILKKKITQYKTAFFTKLYDIKNNEIIDEGIAICFLAPKSFTGENVFEFQGHGSPVLIERIINAIIQQGARLATAGEFSKRAFLNSKIDLTQAEAIADLINADNIMVAKSAIKSLQGEFSQQITIIRNKLLKLRIYVESQLDFSTEEIDVLNFDKIQTQIINIISMLDKILCTTKQGVLLNEGIKVVIAGNPNVGKSSLINKLTNENLAIVTAISGTTRDVLKTSINIDGLPIHIIDTAGLRDTTDIIEKIGIKKSLKIIKQADIILFVIDADKCQNKTTIITALQNFKNLINNHNTKILILRNKIDLLTNKTNIYKLENYSCIDISVEKNIGIELLKQKLKTLVGFNNQEAVFIARKRHLIAIKKTKKYLQEALLNLMILELLAEDLRLSDNSLGEITGVITSDQFLGEIFSSFCIGK